MATLSLLLLLLLAVVIPTSLAQQQQQQQQQPHRILNYQPQTQVYDVAALDQDQAVLEELLMVNSFDAMQRALAIYINGAHSKSYANLTLEQPLDPSSLDGTLEQGAMVVGTSVGSGSEVRGTLLRPLSSGDTHMLVQYETTQPSTTTMNNKNHNNNPEVCQVGADPNPKVDGCFAAAGSVTVGNPGAVITLKLPYMYDPLQDNHNARTLQSLSTNAKQTMFDCPTYCPYEIYQKFYKYYKEFDYGNNWILAAFNEAPTNYAESNADFSLLGTGSRGIIEAVRKGTVALNIWMKVIQSMEHALDQCRMNAANDTIIGSWDEAVAYYVGSYASNGRDGYFVYSLAEKRCQDFQTCNSGVADVNRKIMKFFKIGQESLLALDCDTSTATKQNIEQLMTIPIIQGLLRDVYWMDKQNVTDDRATASGATNAAATLPLIHSCNRNDAQIVFGNMGIGQTDKPSFDTVKAALEANYGCLGISCADVGGLIDPATNDYFAGALPCSDSAAQNAGIQATNPPSLTATYVAGSGMTTNETSSSSSSCPPCAISDDDNPNVSITKSLVLCTDLVREQIDLIAPTGCSCACFVDNAYSFCANPDMLYTGSGSIMGPCQVTVAAKETGVATGTTTTEALVNATASSGSPNDTTTDDSINGNGGSLIGSDANGGETTSGHENKNSATSAAPSSQVVFCCATFLIATLAHDWIFF